MHQRAIAVFIVLASTSLVTVAACADAGSVRARCPAGGPPTASGLCAPGSADTGPTGPIAPGSDAALTDALERPDACVNLGAGSVGFSEVFFDPAGADDAAVEFIELWGTPRLDLRGLRLVGSNSDDRSAWLDLELTGHRLDDHGVLLLGADASAMAAGRLPTTLQNGPDQLDLLDCDGVSTLDTVGWDRARAEAGRSIVSCDGAWVAAAPTPGVVALEACEADPADAASMDTDDAGRADDAVISDANDALDTASSDAGDVSRPEHDEDAQLEAADVADADAACDPVSGLVQIHEVFFDPEGADEGHEFVELHGVPGVVLDRVALVGLNGRDGLPFLEAFELRGQIDDTGLFVIGQAQVEPRSMVLPGPLQNGPDSIVLIDCDREVIDAIAFGEFAPGEFSFGEGRPAMQPRPGRSLSRDRGSDTDDNATDFAASIPGPGEFARTGDAVDTADP